MTKAHALVALWEELNNEFDKLRIWHFIEDAAESHITTETGSVHKLEFADGSTCYRNFNENTIAFYDGILIERFDFDTSWGHNHDK